jgi:hypothetical protein
MFITVYLLSSQMKLITFHQNPESRIQVSLHNGATITSTHTGIPRIPGLPLSAHQAHVLHNLASISLLSIAQLCAHGCTSLFTNATVTITLRDTLILTGT